MKTEWRTRLEEAIKLDPRSARQIGVDAGLGTSFVGEMVRNGKDPSTENLVRLTDALGVSLTYIFTGAEMTPEQEEILRLAAGLPKDKRDLVLELLRGLRSAAPD